MENSNSLRYLNDFRVILKDYKPNLDTIETLNKIKFALLVAPSAAGRNTLIHQLLKTGKYHFIISDTTRLPRANNGIMEQNGVEYWFKKEEEFLEDLKKGAYLEAAIIHNQQVSGVSLAELNRSMLEDKIAITDIEIQGCENIVGLSESFIPIFVLPPKFEEWMRRMDTRGNMSLAEKRNRLISAQDEISVALKRDYFKFVINDDLTFTANELHRHIISDNFEVKEQNSAKEHALELLEKVQLTLKNLKNSK